MLRKQRIILNGDIMSDKFNFWIPLKDKDNALEKAAKTEKGTDKRYENMILEGMASDNSKDSEGEVLEPSGYDVSRFMKSGFINFEHKSKYDPKYLIGEPIDAKVKGDQFYVKGKLYKDSEIARNLWDTAIMMKSSGATRNLGWSIEGKALERSIADPKRITKALITGVALTFNPVNASTFAEICKGEQKEDFVNYQYAKEDSEEGINPKFLYEFNVGEKQFGINKSFQCVEIEKAIIPDIEKKGDSAMQKKIKKVMAEFKAGTLKDSHGNIVTDRDMALAIAMSKANDQTEKAMDTTSTAPLIPESLNKKTKVLTSPVIKKALLAGIIPIETVIEKAKSGVYEDTRENRKLGRVGQRFGSKKEKLDLGKKSQSGVSNYSEKLNEAKKLFSKKSFNISSNSKGFRATLRKDEYAKSIRMDSRAADNLYKKIKELGLEWKGYGSHFDWAVDIK